MPSTAVTLVAGFLGSGKTTLLRRVVGDPAVGPRVAVIVNELGALGLDEELIASARTTASVHITQLVSGCVCCTLRGELSDALRELVATRQGPPLEHILIEASGAARVTEVAFAVEAASLGAPFHAEAVVTVVDAANARRCLAEHQDLFEDQLRQADLVLLNKRDRIAATAEAGADADALLALLRPLAPRAQWLWTDHADVAPDLLLGCVPPAARRAAYSPDDAPLVEPAPSRVPGHGFTAVSLPAPRPLDRDALEGWLEALSSTIYRIKGVVDVTTPDAPASPRPVLVQAVGDRVEIDDLDDASPLAQSVRRLVLIGVAPDRAHLAASLDTLAASSPRPADRPAD